MILLTEMTDPRERSSDLEWKNPDFANGHLPIRMPFSHLSAAGKVAFGCASLEVGAEVPAGTVTDSRQVLDDA